MVYDFMQNSSIDSRCLFLMSSTTTLQSEATCIMRILRSSASAKASLTANASSVDGSLVPLITRAWLESVSLFVILCGPASAFVGSPRGLLMGCVDIVHLLCVCFFVYLFVLFTGIARTLSRWCIATQHNVALIFYASIANSLFFHFMSSCFFNLF